MSSYIHACRNLQDSPLVMWFTGSIVVSLLIWLAHYIAVFLTVGSMVMINLRILGIAGKSQTIAQISDLYSPWMWIGLCVLLFSGLLMLAGDAILFCTNSVFGINLLITALAAVSGVIVQKSVRAWDRPTGAPAGAKLLAGVSLLLWLGTILTAVEVPARSNVP